MLGPVRAAAGTAMPGRERDGMNRSLHGCRCPAAPKGSPSSRATRVGVEWGWSWPPRRCRWVSAEHRSPLMLGGHAGGVGVVGRGAPRGAGWHDRGGGGPLLGRAGVVQNALRPRIVTARRWLPAGRARTTTAPRALGSTVGRSPSAGGAAPRLRPVPAADVATVAGWCLGQGEEQLRVGVPAGGILPPVPLPTGQGGGWWGGGELLGGGGLAGVDLALEPGVGDALPGCTEYSESTTIGHTTVSAGRLHSCG